MGVELCGVCVSFDEPAREEVEQSKISAVGTVRRGPAPLPQRFRRAVGR